MSPKRRWWSLILVSLIAAAAIGSWGCCSVTCCDTKPRSHLVLVPADERVSPDDIVISWSKHQEIVWKLASGSNIVGVDLLRGNNPTFPFACDSTSPTGKCRIACRDGLCQSGPIVSDFPQPTKKPYPYFQYEFGHGDRSASTDPGIRIDP